MPTAAVGFPLPLGHPWLIIPHDQEALILRMLARWASIPTLCQAPQPQASASQVFVLMQGMRQRLPHLLPLVHMLRPCLEGCRLVLLGLTATIG